MFVCGIERGQQHRRLIVFFWWDAASTLPHGTKPPTPKIDWFFLDAASKEAAMLLQVDFFVGGGDAALEEASWTMPLVTRSQITNAAGALFFDMAS